MDTQFAEMDIKTFLTLRDFLYERSGLFFAEAHKVQLEKYLHQRIKEKGFRNYSEYVYFLRYSKDTTSELQYLFILFSNANNTFFPNTYLEQALIYSVFPELISSQDVAANKKLAIWVPNFQSGEIVYTIAIIVKEFKEMFKITFDFDILATNNDIAQLALAREGVYGKDVIGNVPLALVDKYFAPNSKGFAVKDEIKSMVNFTQVDLKKEGLIKEIGKRDIIIARNVLLFYPDNVKQKLINEFYDILNLSGYLFLGEYESIRNFSKAYRLVHFPGIFAYKK